MASDLVERVKGIEPSSSDWKSEALPLSYTRRPITVPALEGPAATGWTNQVQGSSWTLESLMYRNRPPSNRWNRPPEVPAGSSSERGYPSWPSGPP